jgi:oligopeptide/dipeptide ABC transporter, ATP-binding protein, C-terminal domain
MNPSSQPAVAPLLSVKGLSIDFQGYSQTVHAVDGLDFHVDPGETLAIVGESGSGKTVAALSLMGLLPSATARVRSGAIDFQGIDLAKADAATMRKVRSARIGMVFQEPMTSLNPLIRIGRQIAEPLEEHLSLGRAAVADRVRELLRLVQLPDSEDILQAYPHQLSGGMRQRVMIAMAIACEPTLLIADEPTTALDVTVQAQILELLASLKERLGMAIILITHDLAVVAETADRVVVMYAGRAVECGTVDDVLETPQHPYTVGLLRSTIQLTSDRQARLPEIPGTVPVIRKLEQRCTFIDRCDRSSALCSEGRPAPVSITDRHWAACVRARANA